MTTNQIPSLAQARTLHGQLRASRETAPAAFVRAVLQQVAAQDFYAPIDTSRGRFFVAFNERGVSAIDEAADETEFEDWFRGRLGRRARRVDALPGRLERPLRRRLEGDRRARVRVDLSGITPFERDVLEKTAHIPHGEVRPYAWVAREIGRPRAVRAVGTALAHNPIPLVIPCHRVVRSDGTIGQYGLGGPERKRQFLTEEGVPLPQLQSLAAAGIRYLGSDTTNIFCLPTCHDARRTTSRHLVTFRSAAESFAAGYRPCMHCRPVAAQVAA